MDVRHGGLGLKQPVVAAAHSSLEPKIAYFMKILCSQEIYRYDPSIDSSISICFLHKFFWFRSSWFLFGRYAMMEMGLDSPDLPMGMLSDLHLERCKGFPFVSTLSFSFSLTNNKLISSGEEVLLQFVKAVKSMKETGQKAEAVWSDYSQRWFTLLHSTRPFIFRDYQDLADHVSQPKLPITSKVPLNWTLMHDCGLDF